MKWNKKQEWLYQVKSNRSTSNGGFGRRKGSFFPHERRNLDLLITAVNIQHEVGGNLAQILETIGHTIRERVRIKGEIQVLTAQGRISAYVITGLPIALTIMITLITNLVFLALYGAAASFAAHLPTVAQLPAVIGAAVLATASFLLREDIENIFVGHSELRGSRIFCDAVAIVDKTDCCLSDF